jgi:hypothetical protein
MRVEIQRIMVFPFIDLGQYPFLMPSRLVQPLGNLVFFFQLLPINELMGGRFIVAATGGPTIE